MAVDIPTIPKITIIKSDGTEPVSNQNMDLDSAGKYLYYWTSTSTGDYIVRMSGVVGAKASLIRKPFRVIETVTN